MIEMIERRPAELVQHFVKRGGGGGSQRPKGAARQIIDVSLTIMLTYPSGEDRGILLVQLISTTCLLGV